LNTDRIVRTYGVVLAIMLIVVAVILGGRLGIFVNIPSMFVTVGVALGLQLVAVGRGAFADRARPIHVLCGNVSASNLKSQYADNLRTMVRHLYTAGGIGTLIGWIQLLTNFDDPSQLGPALAVSLLRLFYAVVLAECIVRPAANRIDYLLEPKE
jgi:flagellar motor component MotA